MGSTENFTMIDLAFKDDVAILTFKNPPQNRLDFTFLEEIHKGLDAVLRNEDVKILITTSDGKYYSNGIDLEGVFGHPEGVEVFIDKLNALLARIMTFPMPTVAALNGHTFAGGMLLALSHDYRVMNNEKGWMSMNEVFMPSRFPPFLLELLRTKVPKGVTQTEVVALGRRFTADEALASGLAQAAVPRDRLIETSVQIAKSLLKHGDYMRTAVHILKMDLYHPLISMLGKYQNSVDLGIPNEYTKLPDSKL